jgi:hypothetical protein
MFTVVVRILIDPSKSKRLLLISVPDRLLAAPTEDEQEGARNV